MNILDQIKNLTGGNSIVAKAITLNGKTETFNFRKLPYAEAQRIGVLPLNAGSEGKINFNVQKIADRNIATIAACLCDPMGTTMLSQADVSNLDADIAAAFLKAANEVNGIITDEAVKAAEKNSDATT